MGVSHLAIKDVNALMEWAAAVHRIKQKEILKHLCGCINVLGSVMNGLHSLTLEVFKRIYSDMHGTI